MSWQIGVKCPRSILCWTKVSWLWHMMLQSFFLMTGSSRGTAVSMYRALRCSGRSRDSSSDDLHTWVWGRARVSVKSRITGEPIRQGWSLRQRCRGTSSLTTIKFYISDSHTCTNSCNGCTRGWFFFSRMGWSDRFIRCTGTYPRLGSTTQRATMSPRSSSTKGSKIAGPASKPWVGSNRKATNIPCWGKTTMASLPHHYHTLDPNLSAPHLTWHPITQDQQPSPGANSDILCVQYIGSQQHRVSDGCNMDWPCKAEILDLNAGEDHPFSWQAPCMISNHQRQRRTPQRRPLMRRKAVVVVRAPDGDLCTRVHYSLDRMSLHLNSGTYGHNILIRNIKGQILILGDFNGHNYLWGSHDVDTRGEAIERFTDKHNLCVLNDGTHT